MVDRYENDEAGTVDGRCLGGNAVECAVVDLDGTLLQGNSLHIFIRFMAKRLFERHRYADVLRIFTLLLARKTGLISHTAMKYPLHRLGVEALSADDCEDLALRLYRSVDQSLLSDLLEMKNAEGFPLLLATAAPDFYVKPLVAHLGCFDAWTATPLSDTIDSYDENRGERKLSQVIAIAAENSWTITTVVTDHSDDLPLLELDAVRHRRLVNPDSRLIVALRNSNLTFTLINR